MKPGEEVLVSDLRDKEYLCEITDYPADTDSVLLRIVDVFGNARELPAKITLFQGYPKGDKMETIIQKAVELGAFEVAPVMMKRCVVKLDDKKALKKVERFNNISLSAAKQSKRGIVPEVLPIMSLKEAVEYAETMDYVVLPYENAEGMDYSRKVLKEAAKTGKIGVFIGPEGGFEVSEVEQIEAIGGKVISLGHRILRTETAGMTVLSLLMYLLEQ
jgi:16S rRNA (uracil1498-N3)-methyltransferase